MKQPRGFEKLNSNGKPYVCKLKKSLYGLRQSPRNWYGIIHDVIANGGLKSCMSDLYVYVKISGESTTNLALYVDDLVVTGSFVLDDI